MQKKAKIRVSKKQINAARKSNRPKTNKKSTTPGPWTEKTTDLAVKVKLRPTDGILGTIYGIYTRDITCERGWYPVKFNVTSKSMRRDILKYGIDDYMAACELSLNTTLNKTKYGTIVLLGVRVDNSLDGDRKHRFISCIAKTNKKSILGFSAVRKREYKIL